MDVGSSEVLQFCTPVARETAGWAKGKSIGRTTTSSDSSMIETGIFVRAVPRCVHAQPLSGVSSLRIDSTEKHMHIV